jgi:peptidyl-prolyl cis-trans isomerase D
MIEQMQKHMSWIMWSILGVIIVSFLFFGIFPGAGGRGVAAKVNDDVITNQEVNRVYRNMLETYRQIFKDKLNDSLVKGLRNQALRDLIQNRLLAQEAARVGLKVSDEEVQTSIMSIPQFSVRGRFDNEAYHRYLDYINMKPHAFEESQRDAILREKLQRIVEDGVSVTDDEVKAAYEARNRKAKKGDFEKEKEKFEQSLLAEKRQTALDAYVEGLSRKAKIVIGSSEAES